MIAEKRYVREFAVTPRRQADGDDHRPTTRVIKSEGELARGRVGRRHEQGDADRRDAGAKTAASPYAWLEDAGLEPGRQPARVLHHLRRLPGRGHRQRVEGRRAGPTERMQAAGRRVTSAATARRCGGTARRAARTSASRPASVGLSATTREAGRPTSAQLTPGGGRTASTFDAAGERPAVVAARRRRAACRSCRRRRRASRDR